MTNTQTETEALYTALIESWMPTHYLTSAALECYGQDGRPLWEGISFTAEDAHNYYRSISDEQARSEAAEILAADGWTVRRVAMRKA